MDIGYARTSKTEQSDGLETQLKELSAAGVNKVFYEQVSSVAHRDQLDRTLEFIREGDTLVITRLDRLAWSVRDLIEIVDRIDAKGAELRILAMNLDTGTPTGRLMLQGLGAVAEFERQIMVERQREGIAKAEAAGKYKGRAATARAKKAEIEALLAAGVGPSEVARRLGIARSSVYRVKEL